VDGVILINQNAALAGGVVPDDSAGFPVTILVSGSYRLSSNLLVTDANTSAILIAASNVTIDLNGFSISGPSQCTGFPVLSCIPRASGFSGNGIEAIMGANNISVFNGTIQGMGNAGIALSGKHIRVENVHAVNNATGGISVLGRDSKVLASTASENDGVGINADGVISGNTANGNAGDGIEGSGSVTNNNAEFNGGSGITGFGSFIGNFTQGNGHQGIFAICTSTIVSNAANGNTGGDIVTHNNGCTRANNAPAP
jgi:hypothetical protein